ncbi:uncharacterized protein LOC132545182 [Ylistrum balloti]|uniref:uncharacterized protein LOC132545182 n=1 Tax=Ylistrum balloti TaxID=509963 RepID=UPI002905BB30|nr:uncharacterized protein LOC132545182 [Ylistrum balloti]
MLTRTGTVVRKNRRRSSSKGSTRRGSAPTVLQQGAQCHSPNLNFPPGTRTYLTPQPSPCKSVSFSFSSEGKNCITPDNLSLRQPSLAPSENKQYYGSVVLWKDTVEPDHAFSFVSTICEASHESVGACDFVYRAFVIISGSWPVTVLLGLFIALPLTMMIIGVKYLDECPKEPKIPIYLLVGGCFGTIKLLMSLCHQIRRLKDDDDEDLHDENELLTMSKMANIGLTIFLSIWFVFGNYWIFETWLPKFQPPLHEPKNWCDRSVFTFTFWQLVVCHIVIGIVVMLAMFLCCCFSCLRTVKDLEKG